MVFLTQKEMYPKTLPLHMIFIIAAGVWLNIGTIPKLLVLPVSQITCKYTLTH